MENEQVFTVADGLQIQAEQLAAFKVILKPEIYDELEKHTLSQNHDLKTGYDVFRGQDIENYLHTIQNRLFKRIIDEQIIRHRK